jgi:hypothetical protein
LELAGVAVDIVENLEQGSFCEMKFHVDRLEDVEVAGFVCFG